MRHVVLVHVCWDDINFSFFFSHSLISFCGCSAFVFVSVFFFFYLFQNTTEEIIKFILGILNEIFIIIIKFSIRIDYFAKYLNTLDN